MTPVGSFEAKTHLSSLLDRVAKGEKIAITRHGIPAAMLVPVEQPGRVGASHIRIESAEANVHVVVAIVDQSR